MSDERPEDVEGTATELPPEAQEAIEDYLPAVPALMDPSDRHEVARVLDEHDVRQLILRAQGAALQKWVYQLPDGAKGLSVDAVQDITAFMNWTGKAKIGVLPETLTVERVVEDAGNGEEPFYVATVFARDELSGKTESGTSMEPVYMQLTEATANKWRKKGKKVPEDRRVFDIYARTKAINKAERNAQDKFIPAELRETIIAMVAKDPSRVERVQTEADQQAEDAQPMLTTDEAKALMAELETIYDRIRELGNGQGKVKLPLNTFRAWLMRSWHDMDALGRFREWLLQREADIPGELQAEAEEREAVETALDIACPACGQGPSWRCKKGDQMVNQPHRERFEARLAQIRGGA